MIVSFKLPDDLGKRLEATAPKAKGMSKHKHAKQIVINYLEDTERVQLQKELDDLSRKIRQLREDLASAVPILLVQAGRVQTLEEANRWVEKNLLSRRSV